MKRRDWVLLSLLAAHGSRLTPVCLQKSLFLLGERGRINEEDARGFYEFEAYAYGPFSKEIYHDAMTLVDEGMVDVFPSSRASSRQYALTVDGVQKAQELLNERQPQGGEYLSKAVRWTQRQSFPQLVSAIYKHFPAYRENSIFVRP